LFLLEDFPNHPWNSGKSTGENCCYKETGSHL
jgi:hypothetical protein